jgi:hypothetical protein
MPKVQAHRQHAAPAGKRRVKVLAAVDRELPQKLRRRDGVVHQLQELKRPDARIDQRLARDVAQVRIGLAGQRHAQICEIAPPFTRSQRVVEPGEKPPDRPRGARVRRQYTGDCPQRAKHPAPPGAAQRQHVTLAQRGHQGAAAVRAPSAMCST